MKFILISIVSNWLPLVGGTAPYGLINPQIFIQQSGKQPRRWRPNLGGNTLEWRAFGKCGEVTPQICQARNFGLMITAAQCRSACTLLSWSLSKLASAASVPVNVID